MKYPQIFATMNVGDVVFIEPSRPRVSIHSALNYYYFRDRDFQATISHHPTADGWRVRRVNDPNAMRGYSGPTRISRAILARLKPNQPFLLHRDPLDEHSRFRVERLLERPHFFGTDEGLFVARLSGDDHE